MIIILLTCFFIGSVIFNLTFSADVKITITNKSARDSGYLALRHLSSTQAQVVLEKSLDLLKLNPQNPPVRLFSRERQINFYQIYHKRQNNVSHEKYK